MLGRAFAFASVTVSLLACGDPAPTSPAALAGEVLLASRAELSAAPIETAAPSAVLTADVSTKLEGAAPVVSPEPPPPEEVVMPSRVVPEELAPPPPKLVELDSMVDVFEGNGVAMDFVVGEPANAEQARPVPAGVMARPADGAIAELRVAEAQPRTIAGSALAKATVTDLEKAMRDAGCTEIKQTPDATGKQHALLTATCGGHAVTVTFVPTDGLPLDDANKSAIAKNGAIVSEGGAFLGLVIENESAASARALLNKIAKR